MRIRILLVLLVAIFLHEESFAQFNIFKKIEYKAKGITQFDTLEHKEVQVVALNEAYERNRRRTIRKERNYFYIENQFYLTQYGYINWDKTTENTFTGRLSTNAKYVYKYNDFDVTSNFTAAYAMGNVDSVLWKTEDWFSLNANVNYRFSNYFYYTLNTELKSQFTRSYGSKHDTISYSNFLAPATFSAGLGFNYKIDNAHYIIFTPLTGNMVIVNNERLSQQGYNGVQPGRRTEVTFGAQATINWTKVIIKDTKNINGGANILNYRGYVTSYWGYESRTPTLSWQSWLDLGIYKYFNINLYWVVEFNDVFATPMEHFWRSRQTLGIGLKYSIANK